MLSGKRIFLVEDEVIIAMTAEDMLSALGATVVGPAYNVADGISLAQSEQIDAAVLDLNMNGESSAPIAEALQARGIPFIFATAYSDNPPGKVVDAPVVGKPYTEEKLGDALASLLNIDR